MKEILTIILALSIISLANKATGNEHSRYRETSLNLRTVTTEKGNPHTSSLSHVFEKNMQEGLKLLVACDSQVIEGCKYFLDNYLVMLSDDLGEKIARGGRVFLVGSGSSGRVGIDIAEKWKSYWNRSIKLRETEKRSRAVTGIIAGGARAFVKAKEGFEDSEEAGREALAKYRLTEDDTVILISASGSARFNVGAAQEASEQRGMVYYFTNSKKPHKRAQDLSDKKIAKLLIVDIGAQAISGSTRLQAATLAEVVLGATLTEVIKKLNPEDKDLEDYPEAWLPNLYQANTCISENLDPIERMIHLEVEVFEDKDSNFRRTQDETEAGYVTFIGTTSLREIMIDSTETAPTFTTNPPRSRGEALNKKAEFRAYHYGSKSNREAWQALVTQEMPQEELEEADGIIISTETEGNGSFIERPQGKGNLLIGVLKEGDQKEGLDPFFSKVKAKGGKTGFIQTAKGNMQKAENAHDASILISEVPKDPLGIIETVVLKQVLNLISNGSMIKMKKVHGNLMLDVALSNEKLVVRGVNLVKKLSEHYNVNLETTEDALFQKMENTWHYKCAKGAEGIYVPSPVKIVMVETGKQCNREEAIDLLKEWDEDIEKILAVKAP